MLPVPRLPTTSSSVPRLEDFFSSVWGISRSIISQLIKVNSRCDVNIRTKILKNEAVEKLPHAVNVEQLELPNLEFLLRQQESAIRCHPPDHPLASKGPATVADR